LPIVAGSPEMIGNPIFGSAVLFESASNESLQYESCFLPISGGFSTNLNTGVAAWVYVPSTSESGPFVKMGTIEGASDNGWGIGVGAGDWDGNGNNLLVADSNWRSGGAIGTGWHHVAATYNGSGDLTMFLDGRVAATTASGSRNIEDRCWLGGYPSATRYTNCRIADVRIYNRQLTSADAWHLYDPRTRWELYQAPTSRLWFNRASAAVVRRWILGTH
jgi:hypothetical protein